MYKGRHKTTPLQNPRHPIAIKKYAFNNKDIPLQKDWSQRWCMLLATFDESNLLHEMLQMEVRKEDVFVVTYMKCGTTWMQETAWLLLNNLNFDKAKELPLTMRSPFLDIQALDPNEPKIIQMCSGMENPRLLKTHLPASLCPVQMWQKRPKIIYVARNAKDAIVSCYHFIKGLRHWIGNNIEDFVTDFLNDENYYSNFWEHIVEFWQMRNEDFIFFTTYEEMKRDLAGVLQKLCKFLERPELTKDELEKTVQHLSFDSMKDNKSVNMTQQLKEFVPGAEDSLQFMRRGIVGSYKDELTPELKQKIDEWSSKCLAQYGLKEEDIFGVV